MSGYANVQSNYNNQITTIKLQQSNYNNQITTIKLQQNNII